MAAVLVPLGVVIQLAVLALIAIVGGLVVLGIIIGYFLFKSNNNVNVVGTLTKKPKFVGNTQADFDYTVTANGKPLPGVSVDFTFGRTDPIAPIAGGSFTTTALGQSWAGMTAANGVATLSVLATGKKAGSLITTVTLGGFTASDAKVPIEIDDTQPTPP